MEAAAEEELAEEEMEAAAEEELRYEEPGYNPQGGGVASEPFYGAAQEMRGAAAPEEPMPDFLPSSDSALPPFPSPTSSRPEVGKEIHFGQPPTPPSAGPRGQTTALPASGPSTLGAPMAPMPNG